MDYINLTVESTILSHWVKIRKVKLVAFGHATLNVKNSKNNYIFLFYFAHLSPPLKFGIVEVFPCHCLQPPLPEAFIDTRGQLVRERQLKQQQNLHRLRRDSCCQVEGQQSERWIATNWFKKLQLHNNLAQKSGD